MNSSLFLKDVVFINEIVNFQNDILNLEFSELIIENILIENAVGKNYDSINPSSFLILKSSLFNSKKLTIRRIKNNFYSSFIKASDSVLIFDEIYMNDIYVNNSFIFIHVLNSEDKSNFSNVYLNRCIALNVSVNLSNFQIVKGEQEINEFNLRNSKLKCLDSRTDLFAFKSVHFSC